MLTNREKKYLKGLAQTRRPLFQVGKDGVTANMMIGIDDALEAHELVKITLLKTCPQTIEDVRSQVSSATYSDVIQVIGKTAVFYRKSKKNKLGL